jgi:hypothetical protein
MIEHAAWSAARDDADRGAVAATLRWVARGLSREIDGDTAALES